MKLISFIRIENLIETKRSSSGGSSFRLRGAQKRREEILTEAGVGRRIMGVIAC